MLLHMQELLNENNEDLFRVVANLKIFQSSRSSNDSLELTHHALECTMQLVYSAWIVCHNRLIVCDAMDCDAMFLLYTIN